MHMQFAAPAKDVESLENLILPSCADGHWEFILFEALIRVYILY